MATTEAPAAPRRRGPPPGTVGRRPHWVHVGHRLKALREEAHLSQKQFALLTKEVDPAGVGLSSYSINRHEQSIHAPRPQTVDLLAATLTRALGRTITPADLRLTGADGLREFLENVRTTQGATMTQFYGMELGVPLPDVAARVSGEQPWTLDELRRIGKRYTEAADLVRDVLLA